MYPDELKEKSEPWHFAKLALDKTFQETMQLPDGEARAKVIVLAYVRRTHTVEGAAQEVYASRASAFRWSKVFFKMAAKNLGL